MTTVVRIVGFGEGKEKIWDAPKGPEVWGCNALRHPVSVIADRWFQLHDRSYIESLGKGWEEELKELGEIPKDGKPLVYMCESHDDIPASIRFPKEEVEALTPHGAYHCGTFDWMVPFAILEGFQRIELYGISFAEGGEPLSARSCLEYWLGVAEARGIEVYVEPPSDLFKYLHIVRSDRQYGYDPKLRLVVDDETQKQEELVPMESQIP